MTSQIVLGVVAIFALAVLWRWQRAPDEFDLRRLLVDAETGQPSLFRIGQLCALVVSTWAFVVLTQRDKMTEWYFMGYMASWAGANLLSKFIDMRAPK